MDEHDEHINNPASQDLDHESAILQRRDDKKFMFEMEGIAKEAEATRMRFMRSYRNRNFLVTAVTILSVFGGTAGFAWFFLMNANLKYALACIAMGFIIPPIISILKKGPIKAYKDDHKSHFMPRLAKALGGFKYFKKRGISSKIISKSGITDAFSVYDAEDCFMGVYKGVKVIMSEARLYQDLKKHNQLFNGLFVLLELSDNIFKGHTIITSDMAMVKSHSSTKWQSLTALEKPENKAIWQSFEAYSSNPEHAKEQITDEFLKELDEASDIFDNAHISAVMFGKKYIFITVPYEGDMFEASNLFIPVEMKSYIRKCKQELEKILEIIDIFELYKKSAAQD